MMVNIRYNQSDFILQGELSLRDNFKNLTNIYDELLSVILFTRNSINVVSEGP